MNLADVFQNALNLNAPWQVSEVRFDAEKRRLTVMVDLVGNYPISCPLCSQSNCKSHGMEHKTWRHLNFFQHEAFISARIPIISCPRCGSNPISTPWSRADTKFTRLYEMSMQS